MSENATRNGNGNTDECKWDDCKANYYDHDM